MADVTALKAAVDAAVAQAEKTRGTEASAAVIIATIKDQLNAAVTTAIENNDNIDNSAIAVVTQAINDTLKVFADSDDALGAAIAANNPTPPPEPTRR
jgi:microcompartment protein CcmL/EutN